MLIYGIAGFQVGLLGVKMVLKQQQPIAVTTAQSVGMRLAHARQKAMTEQHAFLWTKLSAPC